MGNDIYVTKPYLPPLEDFIPYLEEIWESHSLTNNGPFHQELEQRLCEHLGVEHLALFANGTLALITALQALRISGEVITTPFSFAATTHALHWNGIKPVFADIEAGSFGLDPKAIEAAITPQTTAILPVHVYGRPCAVTEIQQIADTYDLKVIYDAAHAFGVEHNDQSVLNYGDLSILSFHATKVFNTFEGGAIICKDAETKQHIDFLKNVGFADETIVVAPGINGKMNEVQAAFGLLQLKHIDQSIAAREEVDCRYRTALKEIPHLELPMVPQDGKYNFSYFPILLGSDFALTRDELYDRLREQGVYARRYFYPLISSFSTYSGLPSAAPGNLTVADDIANRVLCLPIYPDLTQEEQSSIISNIVRAAYESHHRR